ncbi:large proline-rich protein bag6-A isoform X1 [Myzus persicae]|uniref:large proline-rich protein bag6-A isoform X1 n=1 Tax=Myzus persicae TaxID=13164 RepID=UPI000B939AFA|nr:large proline-rich protein bag6-A isoform X1 [Myzus persicae]
MFGIFKPTTESSTTSNAKMIDLTIKTLDSQNHKFRVPDTFTILELKEFIAAQVNVAVVQQRLIFCGRVLSNETKLADIGIDGKVMHLVQKVPRLSTTTSGSSSSTTTNTTSRSAQHAGPGFRGWHTHDPTVLFGAIGIPSELMHAGELPRLISTRNHGTGNRVSLALDMIRRANDILNRLEHPRPQPPLSSHVINPADQYPVGSQQAEASSPSVPPEGVGAPESSLPESSASESSVPQSQTDPDSVNVSYEVDETFPNTVVVTIDATHHMRMPPGLMRQVHNHMQANNLFPMHQNTTETSAESEVSNVPENVPVGGSTNQSSAEQATGTLPSSASSEQPSRNDRQTSESRSTVAVNDRRRLRELIEELNKLNERLRPFYAMYCQFIVDDPRFETIEGEHGSLRAQSIFNGVSEVMHFISHVYHAISDVRIAFNRSPPRSFQSRPCLLQGTILHAAHSVTTTTTAAPPSTQQPTSTQTTTTSQSIPSVRAFRLDYGEGSETPNVSTSATEQNSNSNTNMSVDPNTESNNTSTEFPSSTETPQGVELLFDLAPGSIRIDSVEAAFINPTAPAATGVPAAVSQPQQPSVTIPDPAAMPIDWMDQMIDVISSGVRRPFMSEPSSEWHNIPTTSTRTPRVTPRTTDSSSTTNPPSQGLARGRWDSTPRMDPFLPCSSHHFEPNLRPVVLARRSTQGTDRSTSSATSGNSTTDTSSPTSPNEVRSFTSRRPGRSRTRYLQDSDAMMSGIHPILTWGRQRNNTATTSASNIAQATGQGSSLTDALAGQIRVGMESVFDTLEREVDFDRTRDLNLPPTSSSVLGFEHSMSTSTSQSTPPNVLLTTPIGEIPYFRSLEGQSLLVDLFLMISRNWTLRDMFSVNLTSETSTLRTNPVATHSEELINFILDRIMLNRPPSNQNIEDAANRIFLEIVPYINIFQCTVPTRTNINVNASFRRCILQNLRGIINFCGENRIGAIDSIVNLLSVFAEGFLSLIVYCCNSRPIFRLCVSAVMQYLPLPSNLHILIMDELRANIDQYWERMTTFQMMSLSVVDYIVPFDEAAQLLRASNNGEQSSNPSMPSSENINEPLPEVVIGSQDWHHNVPSEWVPVIARDSQRQRRQGTQPPYSDAYLSGMPNKRRKIVTSSKPQGSLSQIIAKNLEVAMGAAGVAINTEVITSAGADTAVQNAYTERIRTFGRSGLDTHPDFCPTRYPNASKFFYDHNHQN